MSGATRTTLLLVTRQAVLEALDDVKDPEIPVVSVVELGIVQDVTVSDAGAHVALTITPTFTGCPALELMRHEIKERILELGASSVDVTVSLDPPWSSDRIAPAARERMKAIGLAPPPPARRFRADADLSLGLAESVDPVPCPFCGSGDTRLENPFGPTICRSLHYCDGCSQSFEQFKAL